MPHFYIDTYDGIAVIDEVGQSLPDIESVHTLVRRSLSAMMRDISEIKDESEFRAVVRDEFGNQLMTATLRMSMKGNVISEALTDK